MPFEIGTVHAVSSDAQEELAASFALEAQASAERDSYLAHLRLCGVCRDLASQFQAVADLLPDALEEEAASPGLKQRVLARAASEMGEEPPPPRPVQTPVAARKGWLERLWPGWLSPAPAVAIAVLALVAIGLGVWNVSLRSSVNEQSRTLADQSRFLEAIASGARVSFLEGTEAAPQASAVLVQEPGIDSAFLLVSGLPHPPANQEYQVWRITGDGPEDAGIISIAGSGEQLLVMPVDFFGADAIGVSLEPKGGSLQPTGDIVLLGSF